MKTKKTLLFVGYRRQAIIAAHELNANIIVCADHKPPHAIQKLLQKLLIVDFSNATQLAPLITELKKYTIDAIYPLTEKAVPMTAQLAEALNIPGISCELSERCHDKYIMKQYLREYHIPLTEYSLIDEATSAQQLVKQFSLPIVIKPRAASGSRQLQYIYTLSELEKTLIPNFLAEKFIYGREMSVESFVQDGNILFTNITDYHTHQIVNTVPSLLDSVLIEKIKLFNQHIIKTLEITTAITHLEFFITENEIIFGEIAIRPPGGFLMDLISHAYQFSAWQYYLRLAFEKKLSFPKEATHYTAVWIIHPGAGTVDHISGWHKLKKLANVYDYHLKIIEGDEVTTRLGTGEYSGVVFFAAKTYQELINSLALAQQTLHIEMS